MNNYRSLNRYILVFLPLLMGACRPHESARNPGARVVFENQDYGFSFSYPADWKILTNEKDTRLHVTLTSSNYTVSVIAFKEWDIMLGSMIDNFNDFVDYEIESQSDMRFTSSEEMTTTNFPGYRFTADFADREEKGLGFYTLKYDVSYAVLFQADQVTDQTRRDLDDFMAHFTIDLSNPVTADMPLAQLFGITPFTNEYDTVNALKYGRDLLQSRGLDARYYNLAKQEFHRILITLHTNQDTRVYRDTWALLQVADNMQLAAYDTHRFDMEQSIAMQNYEEALRDATFIMYLYPENKKQHQDARKSYNQILQMMNR